MKNRTSAVLTATLAVLGGALAGCNTRTNVSLTGNTPSQFSHVYITAQAVWFNTNAAATPDDSGWVKFPLSTPTTVDLVASEDGTLGSISTDLNLLAGTYSQIRLIPVDSTAALTTSAQTLGALYNAEADYVDSTGTTQQLPLEILNPDKGIGIQTSLRVPIGSVGGALSGTTSTTGTLGANDATSSAGTGDALFGSTTGTTTTATGTTTGTTVTSGTGTTTTLASFAMNIDGTRDLVPFANPSGAAVAQAIMLSSHATAYDLSTVGSIQGTLTLTNVTTSTTGTPAIQVDAETVSADGSRHEVVLTTTVNASGDFLLYPLPTSSSTPAYYDVVIHGPGICTIIIKSVELLVGTSTTSLTPSTATTDTTTGSTTSDTTTETTAATATTNVSTISIGTLVPRAAPTAPAPYTANITVPGGSALPAGALINFYQTPTKADVPYVIEASPIDPFNEVLSSPQGLSTGTIDSGTYSTSGETVNVVSAAPVEGAGHYRVAATAPNYTDGSLTPTIAPPSSGTGPVSVQVSPLTLASGAATGSVVAVVAAAPPGKYRHGELLVSHEGQLVATASLDGVLASGGNVTAVVPAETSASYYYVSVRVQSALTGAISRQWYPTLVDLRSSSSGSVPVTIN